MRAGAGMIWRTLYPRHLMAKTLERSVFTMIPKASKGEHGAQRGDRAEEEKE